MVFLIFAARPRGCGRENLEDDGGRKCVCFGDYRRRRARLFSVSVAEAACTGSNGRGSGKGNGQFTMAPGDTSCSIPFTNFIDDRKKTSVPATQVRITNAPKSGKVGVTGRGLVHTPAKGFKGSDRFCTSNTAPRVKGQTLSGCITVTVR